MGLKRTNENQLFVFCLLSSGELNQTNSRHQSNQKENHKKNKDHGPHTQRQIAVSFWSSMFPPRSRFKERVSARMSHSKVRRPGRLVRPGVWIVVGVNDRIKCPNPLFTREKCRRLFKWRRIWEEEIFFTTRINNWLFF